MCVCVYCRNDRTRASEEVRERSRTCVFSLCDLVDYWSWCCVLHRWKQTEVGKSERVRERKRERLGRRRTHGHGRAPKLCGVVSACVCACVRCDESLHCQGGDCGVKCTIKVRGRASLYLRW